MKNPTLKERQDILERIEKGEHLTREEILLVREALIGRMKGVTRLIPSELIKTAEDEQTHRITESVLGDRGHFPEVLFSEETAEIISRYIKKERWLKSNRIKVIVLAVLLEFKRKNGEAYISMSEVVYQTGYSESSIKAALGTLRSVFHLTIEKNRQENSFRVEL